jgi:hypothetical protein
MNYFKKAFLPLFALVFVFLSINVCAQEKEKTGLNKKLSELKGKIEKITVKVDGKDVVFEGKDAEILAKKMRTGGGNAVSYSIGIPHKTAKVFTITDDSDEEIADAHNELTVSMEGKEGLDKDMKKIKLEKKNGETKLSVTTTDENGKEVTKEYTGEEADKYLEENDIASSHSSTRLKGKISTFGPGKFWIHKGNTPKRIIIEKSDSDDDENTDAEVIIIKSDKKLKKDVTIKAKNKVKKEEKDN